LQQSAWKEEETEREREENYGHLHTTKLMANPSICNFLTSQKIQLCMNFIPFSDKKSWSKAYSLCLSILP